VSVTSAGGHFFLESSCFRGGGKPPPRESAGTGGGFPPFFGVSITAPDRFFPSSWLGQALRAPIKRGSRSPVLTGLTFGLHGQRRMIGEPRCVPGIPLPEPRAPGGGPPPSPRLPPEREIRGSGVGPALTRLPESKSLGSELPIILPRPFTLHNGVSGEGAGTTSE